jgi:hypothetical protein
MKNALRLTRFVTALLSCAHVPLQAGEAPAQREPADWSAWGGVEHWEGTATIRTWSLREYAAHGSQERHETEQSITLRFRLEREPRSTESWRATRVQAEMTGAQNYAQSNVAGDSRQWTESIEYAGALRDIQEMVLVLPPHNGRWEVLTPGRTEQPYPRGAQGSRWRSWPPEVEAISESYPDDSVPHHSFGGQAPKVVGPLEASGVLDLGQKIEHGQYPALKEFRIVLRPVVDPPRVRLIVSIDDYARWRPLGSIAQPGRPGNALAIKATVEGQAGAPPPKVKAIRFRLLDVSREPGVCLNWPLGANDRNPDLKLAATPECPGGVSEEEQHFEVTSPLTDAQRRPYALARVDSYDFGARATLYVTCELTNGRVLVGELPGVGGDATRDLISLPKMKGLGWIAGVWKQENNVATLADNDDGEKVAGQKHDGDGFTLYEEYRGWVVNGQRVEGDPKRKDFFVRLNQVGLALPGVAKFQRLTKLRVHSALTAAEFPSSRVMNANRAQGPHRTRQHGVLVQVDPNRRGSATARGGPGNPKKITSVDLMSNIAAFDATWIAATVAHELGHCVNIWHHGGTDSTVVWFAANGGLFERPDNAAAGGRAIVVMNEQYANLTPAIIAEAEAAQTTYKMEMGSDQGQHSGFENCVMRYDCAETYVYRARNDVRVYGFSEPVGGALCTAPAGTGVNAATHAPQSRYGAAQPNRGGCFQQILVSDAIDAPPR